MSNDTYEVVVQPPYYDDQWACLWARFDENEFWYAPSKDAALDRLQDRFEDPAIGHTAAPPTKHAIEVCAHPDYEGAITLQEIVGSGLASFGISGGGPFGSGESHWRFSHPGYEEVVAPLVDAEDTAVMQVTRSDSDERTSQPWEWTRALWVRTSPESDGLDLWVHDAPRYTWAHWEGADESTIIRALDGDWPATQGSVETIVRYRTIAMDDDQQSHLEWGGLSAATVTRFESVSGTPFAPDFDFAPTVKTNVNDWEYEPNILGGRETWVGPAGNKVVIALHHHDSFSWVKVGDRRLGGAAVYAAPDTLPSKRAAEFTPDKARAAAIEWMETHDPDLWSHDAYHEFLYESPDGWELERKPTVGQGNPKELTVVYEQSAVDPYTRLIRIEGRIGTSDFEVHLAYRRPGDSAYQNHDYCYYDDSPVDLPDRVPIERAYEHACDLAARFDGPELCDEPRHLIEAYEAGEIRGSGPWGAVTPDAATVVTNES